MDRVGTCMKTGRISSIQKSRFNTEIIVSLKLLRETDLIKFSYSRSDFIPKSTLMLSLLGRFIISSVSKNLHCLQYHPIASNPRFSWLWRRKILDSNLRLRICSLKLFSSTILQYLQAWYFIAYGFISYCYCAYKIMNIMVYQSIRGRGPHFTVVRGGAVVVIIEHQRNLTV